LARKEKARAALLKEVFKVSGGVTGFFSFVFLGFRVGGVKDVRDWTGFSVWDRWLHMWMNVFCHHVMKDVSRHLLYLYFVPH
jgi:hypothetical protein